MKTEKIRLVCGVAAALTFVSLTQNLAIAGPTPPTPPSAAFYLNGVNGNSLAGVYTSPYLGGALRCVGPGRK